MKLVLRLFLASLLLTAILSAQETQSPTAGVDETGGGPTVEAAPSVTIEPGCPGNRFNLEPRANALPQNTESVDFLLNRVSPGVDLVVGAGNDQRASIGGFDAYYVHRQGAACAADFEGTVSSGAINPIVVADPARDSFFLADLGLSLSPVVEVARTTASNLLSSTACPSGTQLNGSNPNCWPVVGVADFTASGVRESDLLEPYMAVDPRTSGTGSGDVYVVAGFENDHSFSYSSPVWRSSPVRMRSSPAARLPW